jgi:hypothetical protein
LQNRGPQPNEAPNPNPGGSAAIQIAQLARLAELGMQLAESAARMAQRNMAEPPPDPEPVTPEIARLEAASAHLYRPCPAEPRSAAPRNPATLFNQFARTVRTCINLQKRIITEQATVAGAARPIADPRRVILRRAFRQVIAAQPEPRLNLTGVDHDIDHELEADPDRLTPIAELVTLICEQIGLDPRDIDLHTEHSSETLIPHQNPGPRGQNPPPHNLPPL